MPQVLDDRTLAELCQLAGDSPRLAAFERAGERCGWCAEPVRLRGGRRLVDAATGEVVDEHDSYLKACGTRRATRCPSCAERYRRDAKQIVLAGLEGGKGIAAGIVEHPAIFATLTAPSFGAVHRIGHRGRRVVCREGRERTCVHGRPLTCGEIHDERDHRVGEPLCPDCYDYDHAVLWNALCPELWRRTTIYCRRRLARRIGMSEKAMRKYCRLSFVKVAEYQRRGAVHLHLVARLDPVGEAALPKRLDEGALMASLMEAASQVAVAYPDGSGALARFGTQLDARPLPVGAERSTAGVAGYLAKYSVKGSDDNGALDRRVRSLGDLRRRKLSAHHRRLAETAWRLGGTPGMLELGLRRFAHALGFRGHWLTKSRAWSVTFAHLRAERAAWRAERDDVVFDGPVVLEVSWSFESRGWEDAGEAVLAATRQREMALARREALLELLLERSRSIA